MFWVHVYCQEEIQNVTVGDAGMLHLDVIDDVIDVRPDGQQLYAQPVGKPVLFVP